MSLIAELKRRNVFRVGAAYLAFGWIVIQVTTTVVPALNLPASLVPIVAWVGVLGFPLALIFSWVYELTPEGLKRESEVVRESSITDHTAHRLDRIVIVLLVVAIGLFALDRVWPRAAAPTATQQTGVSAPAAEAGTPAAASPSATGAAPAADDNSIAVLPFTNMSSDPEQEYFSDGLSEELLNLLAQIPELRVIARTSSFAFRGKDVDIATIAGKLNVAHVLEGSVRRSGNTLRITAQLIRAADSSHLWSRTYDREMTDIFKVQDEIASAVVSALKLALLPGQSAVVVKPQTASTEAYNKYLLGRQYNQRQNVDGWRGALAAFEEAIALDPDYAAAWAGLAVAEMFAADYAGTADAIAAGKARSRAAANRAVELGPEVADAFVTRALIRSSQDWDWAGAESDLRKALELDPGSAGVQRAWGSQLGRLGRNVEALEALRRAEELDPLSSNSWNSLASGLWATGDRAGARAAMERALAINPDSDFARVNLAGLDLVEGDSQAALTRFRAIANPLWSKFGIALAAHSLGQQEEAQAALDWLEKEQADAAAYQIGEIHAWRGDKDKAFEWMERAWVQRDGGLAEIKGDFLLDGLRDDPRYAELLKKIGLPP